jgi:hypothetical protein
LWRALTRLLSQAHTSCGPAFDDALGLRSVNAIWQLLVVLPLSVNASRIEEQFFEFLGRLGRLAFYIPQLSINVVAKFPGALDLSLFGISALVLERLGANSLKALAYLTDVFYRYFLAILPGVILAKPDVFIAFYHFPKTIQRFPYITMDVQRLN